MYLRKIEGPRSVTLPDGTIMTQADLPPIGTSRWVASRKALVVRAVAHGLIGKKDALQRYEISEEEFDGWCSAIMDHGLGALKATRVQKYRQS